jgi:hypothetical protein
MRVGILEREQPIPVRFKALWYGNIAGLSRLRPCWSRMIQVREGSQLLVDTLSEEKTLEGPKVRKAQKLIMLALPVSLIRGD